ncbi:glycoside hydrolase family 2 TIM barrel-domain containing protein [Streptomyces prasinosporus]|uniref:glycoside hydrolase family 2 TIM barrel-domain containing protein n=1 Tax=Streptomyces prasinosporus TaxID=68256 RepID=UPI0031ECB09D
MRRAQNLRPRDKNHPSVVIWSLGNEPAAVSTFTACTTGSAPTTPPASISTKATDRPGQRHPLRMYESPPCRAARPRHRRPTGRT